MGCFFLVITGMLYSYLLLEIVGWGAIIAYLLLAALLMALND